MMSAVEGHLPAEAPMDHPPADESFLVNFAAGATAALIGMVSFGIFHTLWILNIPAVFVEGVLYALPAALGLAWAIRVTRKSGRFHGGLRDGLILGFLFWLTLVPYEIAGKLWGPWVEPSTFQEVLPLLWLAFLGVPVGAAIGWAITRKRWPTVAWGAATLTVHFSIGGSIAFFGGRGAMLGLFIWLLPTHLLAGVALVGIHSLRLRRSGTLESAAAAVGSSAQN